MENYLTEKEQRLYFAVYRLKGKVELKCPNGIRLFQFSDVHCKPSDLSNSEHKQWCDEITFAYAGEGRVVHNGTSYGISAGQIHLCFKDERHEIFFSNTSPLKFYCIGFVLEEDNPLTKRFAEVKRKIADGASPILSNCEKLSPAFDSVLSEIYSEKRDEVSDAVIANTLNYIISEVLRGFFSDAGFTENISMKENLVFYAASYLKTKVYDINALSTLSEDIGYSYSYISHLFSKTMGQSLRRFFGDLRAELAEELLLKHNVTEVSAMLGYSSVHAFTRAFKRSAGVSPGSVRQNKK